MRFKKPEILITLFLLIWLGFIIWGMAKTKVQLARKVTPKKIGVETKVVSAKPQPQVKPRKEVAKRPRIGIGLAKKLRPGQEKKLPPTKEKKVTPALEEALLEKEKRPAEVEVAPILVRTFKAKRTDFKDILPAMGTVKGITETELKFEVNGVVSAMNFREGDKVKKGEVVARLDPKDVLLRLEYAKKKLAAAEGTYEMAKKRLQINEGLYQVGAIIKLKLEEAQLEAEKARLEMEMIKQEVEIGQREVNKTTLLAPKDGVIGSKDAEVGEFVTPNNKVVSLIEIGDVFVELGIIEKDINKIKLGQRVAVSVDTYPEQEFLGTIDNIFPVVEGRSRTLTTKVKIANPQGLLLPGMFARANIFIVELKDALVIPATTLIKLGPGVTIVPLVAIGTYLPEDIEKGIQPGLVELRKVEVGYSTTDYAQITSGLNAGELVIIESQGEIKDGVKVKIVGVEESSF